MLLKGAYCVGEHFVDPQCMSMVNYIYILMHYFEEIFLVLFLFIH